MKMLKKGLLLLLFALLTGVGASAQKSLAAKADELFDQNRFVEAVKEYEAAYEKIKDNDFFKVIGSINAPEQGSNIVMEDGAIMPLQPSLNQQTFVN